MLRGLIVSLAMLVAAWPAGAAEPLRYEGVGRVVVFPDVHGAYDKLVSVLQETGVVDESLRWRAGSTHLVSLGDLLDRGADSRKVMEFLMRLESEATAAGGAVHVVLGNHEVMNITGDLRYVSTGEYESYAGPDDDALRDAAFERVLAGDPAASREEFDATHPRGYFAHRQAFSPAGRYGAWLLGKPFLIVINDTAFVHGGLPSMVAGLGLEATNQRLHEQLDAYLQAWSGMERELSPVHAIGFQQRPEAVGAQLPPERAEAFRGLQHAEVFTTSGPTWFRGQALCNPLSETDNLDAALARLGAARVVVGHTVAPGRRVASRFDGRVILLDAGMLPQYGGSAAALVFESGAWSVAYADRPGTRSQPARPPRAIGARPAGLDDDALESWMAQADVVGVEELDAGITEPQRVTLRKGGIELHAVLKRLSTDFGVSRRKALDYSDRFEFEVAAYRLDRLLGLDMVPVTIPRTVNGRPGILQFWIDDSINLRQMTEQQLTPEGWCAANDQYNLMNVFDVLIHNTDRTQENALFTREWMLVLIDHSRAFATYRKNPRLLYLQEPRLSNALAARLQALDRTALDRALGPWLHRLQIEAILKRRDRLLDEHRARTGAAADAVGF